MSRSAIWTWFRKAVCDHRSTMTETRAEVDENGMRHVISKTECSACGKAIPTPLHLQPSPAVITRLLEGGAP